MQSLLLLMAITSLSVPILASLLFDQNFMAISALASDASLGQLGNCSVTAEQVRDDCIGNSSYLYVQAYS